MERRKWTKRLWVALFALALVGGCVTGPDWDVRIGQYTYEQALVDLGPADKTAKLSDGTVIADWLTERAHTTMTSEPYFLPPGSYYGPFSPGFSETYVPDHYLRLIFGPDGKLKSWKKFAR